MDHEIIAWSKVVQGLWPYCPVLETTYRSAWAYTLELLLVILCMHLYKECVVQPDAGLQKQEFFALLCAGCMEKEGGREKATQMHTRCTMTRSFLSAMPWHDGSQ